MESDYLFGNTQFGVQEIDRRRWVQSAWRIWSAQSFFVNRSPDKFSFAVVDVDQGHGRTLRRSRNSRLNDCPVRTDNQEKHLPDRAFDWVRKTESQNGIGLVLNFWLSIVPICV